MGELRFTNMGKGVTNYAKYQTWRNIMKDKFRELDAERRDRRGFINIKYDKYQRTTNGY